MMSNFSYTNDRVFYNGLYLGEHVVWPVIYIKDYQKNWAWVHTDAIFDLEFGDGEYFKLLSFINMLEKRIEDK